MIKPTDIMKVLFVVSGKQSLTGGVAIARRTLANALGQDTLSDEQIKNLVTEYYDGMQWQEQALLELGADQARVDRLQTMAARWQEIARLEAEKL